jgi:hypothetical protein
MLKHREHCAFWWARDYCGFDCSPWQLSEGYRVKSQYSTVMPMVLLGVDHSVSRWVSQILAESFEKFSDIGTPGMLMSGLSMSDQERWCQQTGGQVRGELLTTASDELSASDSAGANSCKRGQPWGQPFMTFTIGEGTDPGGRVSLGKSKRGGEKITT